MPKRVSLALFAFLLVSASFQAGTTTPGLASVPPPSPAQNVPAPEAVLGFHPGDDRKLASWARIVEYFQKLAAASDRVKFAELGKSTMGAPFVMATISAAENLKHLDDYRKMQDSLADPRTLGAQTNPAGSDRQAADLIARGKTVVVITCGIHSTEVGSYLSSVLIAYRLASSNEPEILDILKNTIILLVPSLNPDGVDIVKNWYDKTLGTPYEGTDPPELYHKYTGHDDNRDWYAFTQVETQITVDKILNVWHPQIVHDIHQQGAYGSRLFLPPYMQPVEPNVPKQIVEGYTELGNYLAHEMRSAGFKGITTDSTYDAWSPSRAYSHYHGGVRILQETASCKLATPITVRFDELRSREGYDPQKETPNFGPLWRGGEWHLRDITNTMTTVAFLLLKHASQNRELWLRRFYQIGKDAVRPKDPGDLWGFGIKVSGNTAYLQHILERAGVEDGFLAGEKSAKVRGKQESDPEVTYPSQTILVPLQQPYGAFAKALLEAQHYPNLRDQSGRPIAPYDVTAHTLSLLMETDVKPIYAPFRGRFVQNPHIYQQLHDCVLGDRKKIALYRSSVPAIDEGWTRWVLDRCFNYERIGDEEIRRKDFEQKHLRDSLPYKDTRYHYIIIPDQAPRTILNGYRPGAMPPEYTGGLGEKGVSALREFVEAGGTLVCLNRASDFAIEQFKLPLRDVVAELPRTDFYVPGSILRLELDTTNQIAKGMPKESIAWAEDSPAFEVLSEKTATGGAVHVVGWYGKDKDPLLSGWLLGGERLKGKAALVEVGIGKGRIILFGFRPQYRGQSLATYSLFFNAITEDEYQWR